jgi:sigma-B regulation protein RsbU (phosphoserine phosphatase)
MRILIAEDERITRRSLERQLARWGHHVVATEDGEQAWDEYRSRQFDIVVTDWDMPRCDGRELVSRIREDGGDAYVYLIMLTSRSEKTDVVAGMEAGADDFLAKPFDRDELRVRLSAGERIIRLERALADRNRTLSAANERMSRDLEAAAEVQRDLLPKELPGSLGAAFAWHFEPCDELGGDILNILPLSARHVGLYLLDVSGHGVPAALLSVTLSRVLNTRDPASSILVDREPGAEEPAIVAPPDVAARLNTQFPMSAQRGQYFTMAYAVLDTETGVLRHTLAGHPPPILMRPGQPPRQIEGSGFPVGIVEDAEFDDYRIRLEPGDRMFFFSDGITEARNRAGSMLRPAGLGDLIERSRDLPLDESVPRCIEDLKGWCESTPFTDDISILAFELTEHAG